MRSGGADAGIIASLDLSHLGTGWHTIETDTLVTTDRVTLAFTPTGATPGTVPELELWQLSDATSTEKLAPSSHVFAAETQSDTIAPGNCASFALSLDSSPTLYRRARLSYATTGVVRAFALERTINGLAPQGGSWLAGDTGPRETSEEIDPSILVPGGNEVRLCVPRAATENVVISDLRIVGDIDLGVALAIKAQIESDAAVTGDAAALVDRDPSSTVSIAAGERVVLSLDRLIATDAVTISDGSVSNVECRREASTVRLRATPRTFDRGTRLGLDGQAHSCSELALTFSTDADVAEIDVSGSGTGERVDWPRIVVTSASEHFGTTAWVGGFVAKPSRMRSAIRVELPGQSALPSTGDFGRLLTRTGDAQASWPVAVTARLPDGTAQTQQVVLGRDGRALAANASTSQSKALAAKSGTVTTPDTRFGNEGTAVSVRAATAAATTIRLGTQVRLNIPAGALKTPTTITARHLGEDMIPPLDPGMINVTAPRSRGYEFLPHAQRFARAIEVIVPYDPAAIPDGMTPDDVRTYFFEPSIKRWKPLDRTAIDVGEHVVRSATTHFTIMINAVLAVPKNPTPLSFDPTALSSIAAASPADGITMIAPPQPSQTGDAQLSYPFWLPSGRGKYSPAVSLTYSSGGGTSWAGVGWDVRLSQVEVDTRFGVPRYDGEPRYLLDGAELVPTDETEGPTCPGGVRYRPRIEGGFAHILRCGSSATTYTWEVRDRDGTQYSYGTTSASALTSPTDPAETRATGIARWHITTVEDAYHNRTTFEYERISGPAGGQPWTQVYPKLITYTEHPSNKNLAKYKVHFLRDNGGRPDPIISARTGFKTVTTDRLRAVQVSFDDQIVRTYVLEYAKEYSTVDPSKSPTFHKSVLARLSVFGAAPCTPSSDATSASGCTNEVANHRFEYFTEEAGFATAEKWTLAADDNDNRVLSRGRTISGSRSFGVSVPSPGAPRAATASLTGTIGDRNEELGTYDVNGDGLPDLVFGNDPVQVFLNQAATVTDPTTAPMFTASSVSGLDDMGDEDHLSLGVDVGVNGSIHGVGLSGGAGYESSVSRSGRFFGDLDGDGFLDQVNAGGSSLMGAPCGTSQCFAKRDIGVVRGIDPHLDARLNQIDQDQRDRSVTVSPVIRWAAPYAGRIRAAANAHRVRLGGTSSLAVELWHGDTKLGEAGLAATETADVTIAAPAAFDVLAGESLYVRIVGGNDDIGPNGELFEEVDARLHVEYEQSCFDGPCASTAGLLDAREPTGERLFVFDSSEDFRVAGKPVPILVPIEGALTVTASIGKRVTPVDVRVCLQIYAAGTPVVELDAGCGSTNMRVRESFNQLLLAGSPVPVPLQKTLDVHAGELVVFRVQPEPLPLTLDPEDVWLIPSMVGAPLIAYSSICLPPETGTDCVPEFDQAIIDQVQFDATGFGPFVKLPPLPSTALPGHYERAPAVGFRVPRNGELVIDRHGQPDTIYVRSDLNGLVATDDCVGSCQRTFTISVEAGEWLTFEQAPIAGQPGTFSMLAHYEDDTAHFFGLTGYVRDALQPDIVPTPFAGGYRGWQYSLWNEAIAFEPDRLVEDYRLIEDRIDSRIEEMVATAYFPAATFESTPFGGPAWFSKGSQVFIAELSQNGGLLGTGITPGAGGSGGLFSDKYARMSTTSSAYYSAGVDIPGTFGINGLGGSFSTTNTTTDVVDLNGDGIADVIASARSILGDLTTVATDGGGTIDPSLGDGFRRREGRGYSQSMGSCAVKTRTTAGGRATEASCTGSATGDTGANLKAGVSLNRSKTVQDLVDLNGDGMPDIVSRGCRPELNLPNCNADDVYVRYNLGGRFGAIERFGRVTHLTAPDPFGDKEAPHAELETSKALGHDTTLTAHASLVADAGFASVTVTAKQTTTRTTRQLTDLNGDGLPDLVTKSDRPDKPLGAGGCGQPIQVQYNLGGSFGPVEVWPGNTCWSIPLSHDFSAKVAELLSTLQLTGPNVLASTGSQGGLTISVQGSVPLIPGRLDFTFGGSVSRDVDTYELSLLDADGDGSADHVLRRKTDGGTGELHVKRNQVHGKVNLLKAVSGPLGGTITLEYERVGNTVAMPHSRFVMTSVTVDDGVNEADTSLASPDLVTEIVYEGGVYDRHEKEFYGFAKVTSTRADDVTVEQTFNNSSYALHGRMLTTSLKDKDGDLFTQQVATYDLKQIVDDSGFLVVGSRRCLDYLHPLLGTDACVPTFPVVTRDEDIRAEGSTLRKSRVVEDLQHDRFGNVLASVDHGDDAIASDDLHVTAEYENNTTKWILGRPTHLAVHQGSASGALLRERTGVYCPEGDPKEISVVTDAANHIATTQLKYDGLGNLIELITPPNEEGDSQVFSILAYDPETATYPAVIRNGFGETSSALYDGRFGVAISQTDMNGVTVSRTLDTFGRLETVSGPYDGATPGISIEYVLPETGFRRAVTTTNTSKPSGFGGPVAGQMKTVTVIDGLGRAIQLRKTAVVNGDLGMTTSGLVDRDAVGNVINAYQPFFTAGASDAFVAPQKKFPTSMVYDALDRVVETTYPASATEPAAKETTSFSITEDSDARTLFLATMIDANGHSRETFLDHAGRTRAFVEYPKSDEKSVTRYDYLATDELSRIEDAEGNVTSLGYDLRGLRTRFENDDYGLVEDQYDLMGNRTALIEPNHRASGNGARVRFDYDRDRLAGILYPSKPEVTYLYGAPGDLGDGKGQVGRLKSITDETGTQTLQYDALGAVSFTQRTIKQANGSELLFEHQFVTDSMGRQLAITYPDGETVTNAYDGGGMLAAVTGARQYASEMKYDVFGHRVSTTYGNHVVSTSAFEPERVRLEAIVTTLPGNTRVQDLHYTYDAASNPKTIKNRLNALTNGSGANPGHSSLTLTYDGVDRLTFATGFADLNAQKKTNYELEFVYTPSHNITKKRRDHLVSQSSGVLQKQGPTSFDSTYAYGDGRPHLPSQIGDLVVQYDASGNPISRSPISGGTAQTLTWDDDNRLVDIRKDGVNQQNAFDAAGIRVRRNAQSETIFASPYFDVDNATTSVKHVFAGPVRVASSLGKFASGPIGTPPARPGKTFYYHQDHLQSTTVLTDDDGAVYQSIEYFADGEAWIDRGAKAPTNGYLFSGKPTDPQTGFYDFGQRFYDPRTSLWLGNDAAATDNTSGVVGQPMMLAPAGFAAHNALRFTDPDGRHPAVVGGMVGGGIEALKQIREGRFDPVAIGGATIAGVVTGVAAGRVVAARAAGLISGGVAVGLTSLVAPLDLAIRRTVERKEITASEFATTMAAGVAFGLVANRVGLLPGPHASRLIEGFNAAESGVLREARSIVNSTKFGKLRAAHAAGKSVTVKIGGRTIQYEPGLPASGMTMFGENGFLIGREAFASPAELGKTVLHELHRLTTSAAAAGVSAELAAAETTAAAAFAERAIGFLWK